MIQVSARFRQYIGAGIALFSSGLSIEASGEIGRGDDAGQGVGPLQGLSQAPNANLFTGSMSLSVPILVPPGRPTATPTMALSYMSAGGDGPFGLGWSIPLGAITRDTKHGVPRCTGSHSQDFVVQLAGSAVELVFVESGGGYDLYRARIDDGYLEAHAFTGAGSANRWEVFDRQGQKFVFGGAPNAKIFSGTDTFLSTPSCEFTSAWYLTRMEDPNGNSIDTIYDKVTNAIYPASVAYGGNSTAGVGTHPFQVRFERGNIPGNTALRDAAPISHRLGAKVVLSELITQIVVEYKAESTSSYQTLRTYTLAYDQLDSAPGKALLTSVSATDLPTQTFEYSPGDRGMKGEVMVVPEGAVPPGALATWEPEYNGRTVLDMNGDAFADLIVPQATASPAPWGVYYGSASGISSAPLDWKVDPYMRFWHSTRAVVPPGVTAGTFDITGDGIPDFVDALTWGRSWVIFPGSCELASGISYECGFGPGQHWLLPASAPVAINHLETTYSFNMIKTSGLLDVNGDGFPDLVYTRYPDPVLWLVYLNKGTGCPAGPCEAFESVPANFLAGGALEFRGWGSGGNTFLTHLDFNGDGLPDKIEGSDFYTRVQSDGSYSTDPNDLEYFENINVDMPVPGTGFAPLIRISLNTGTGFSASLSSAVPYITDTNPWYVPPAFPQYMRYRPIVRVNSATDNAPFGVRPEAIADFMDVNGDGLPDFVYVPWPGDPAHSPHANEWWVVLNRGDGRLEDLAISGSPHATWHVGNVVARHRMDGFTGGIRRREGINPNSITNIDVLDWNGDGFVDRVDTTGSDCPSGQSGCWLVTLNGFASGVGEIAPNLLVQSENGIGGETTVRYEPSTRFDHSDPITGAPSLPITTWVTTGIRRTDGQCSPTNSASSPSTGNQLYDAEENSCIPSGSDLVQTLDYAGGSFDGAAREFRGFRHVMAKDAENNSVDTTFSQADFLRGKVLERKICSGSCTTGKIVQQAAYTWLTRVSSLSGDTGNRTQVYLAEERKGSFSLTADASLNLCAVHLNNEPDDWGRVALQCGMPCAGAPAPGPAACTAAAGVEGSVSTAVDWANPTAGSYIRERPTSVVASYVSGGVSKVLSDQRFRYDGAGLQSPLPQGQVTKGNLRWTDSALYSTSAGPGPTTADWPRVMNDFDAFGNITVSVDPNGGRTETDFGSKYFHLRPTEERLPATNNDLVTAHVSSKEWDLRSGAPTEVRIDADRNGIPEIAEMRYDSLGRLICEAGPIHSCAAGGTPTRSYIYSFGVPGAAFPDNHSRVVVYSVEPSNSTGAIEAASYADALGRRRFQVVEGMVNGSQVDKVVTGQVAYDAVGRVRRAFATYLGFPVSAPTAASTLLDYSLNGGTTTDPLGRVHRETPPDGNETRTFYEGARTRERNAAGGESYTLRDALGRVNAKESWIGGSRKFRVSYTLDGAGRSLTRTLDEDPTTEVSFRFDELGRLIRTQDPDSGIWTVRYDKAGNRISQNDPKAGQHVEFSYDEHNRVRRRCFYSTDAFVGNSCFSNAENPTTIDSSFYYDTAESYDSASGSAVSFGLGKLTEVGDSTGSERFYYDRRGQVAQAIKTIGFEAQTDFSYDAAGRIHEIEYPDGEIVEHSYNAIGQLIGVASALSTYLSHAEYDLFGRATTIDHGNGVTDTYDFWDASENFRLETITTAKATSTYQDLDYSYNSLGKVAAIQDHHFTISDKRSNQAAYQYDDLGRLDAATIRDLPAYDYDFDETGNLVKKENLALVYDTPGRPHQVGSFGANLVVYHDANGQRDSKGYIGYNGSTFYAYDWEDYHYDALGHLTKIDVGVGNTQTPTRSVEYAYDYADRRVQRSITSTTPVLYFSELAEYNDGLFMKYYFAGDRLLATRVDTAPSYAQLLNGYTLRPEFDWSVPFAIAGVAVWGAGTLLILIPGRIWRPAPARNPARAAGSALLLIVSSSAPLVLSPSSARAAWCAIPGMIRHYHADHLGSTQVITNETGNPVRYLRYLPFGDLRDRLTASGTSDSGSDVYRREFTSYETEFFTELQYAGARFYDPELGQFLSHDPADSLASPYAYSPADPINTIDPSGESALLLGALFFGGFLFVTNATLDLLWAASTGGDLGKAAIGIAINAGITLATFAVGYGLGVTTNFFSSSYAASASLGNGVGVGLSYAASAAFIGYGGYQSAANLNPVGVLFALSGLYGLALGLTSTFGQAAASGLPASQSGSTDVTIEYYELSYGGHHAEAVIQNPSPGGRDFVVTAGPETGNRGGLFDQAWKTLKATFGGSPFGNVRAGGQYLDPAAVRNPAASQTVQVPGTFDAAVKNAGVFVDLVNASGVRYSPIFGVNSNTVAHSLSAYLGGPRPAPIVFAPGSTRPFPFE